MVMPVLMSSLFSTSLLGLNAPHVVIVLSGALIRYNTNLILHAGSHTCLFAQFVLKQLKGIGIT